MHNFGTQADFANIIIECEDILEKNQNTYEIFQEYKETRYRQEYPNIMVSKNDMESNPNVPENAHDLENPNVIRFENRNNEF